MTDLADRIVGIDGEPSVAPVSGALEWWWLRRAA
jgi:hypothetical protein